MTTRLGLRRVGRAVVTGSGRFSPAPSGDLIHHPHEADGVSWQLGPLGLATDLLHHGHKVRGVVLASECFTPRSRHNTSTKPNLWRPRDRQTGRFVATARLQPRAVSHANRSPPARPTPVGAQRVAGGRAQRPPPDNAPPQHQHPEGGARKHDSTGPTWTILTDWPTDFRVRPRP